MAASKLLIVSLGVATAIGAPQPDPLLYTNPGLSYLSPVPYNQQFYRVGVRDNCLPNTYEDNTVHRYQIGKDHFYTTDLTEIGVTNVGMVGNHGYKYEGPGFIVLANQEEGSVALYRYYNHGVIDHFYTTNQAEINVTEVGEVGNHGYKLEGVLGYCFTNPTTGTKPLHRYYNKELYDHFYTINFEELGSCSSGQERQCSSPYEAWRNARYEGIQCYVYPAQAVDSL